MYLTTLHKNTHRHGTEKSLKLNIAVHAVRSQLSAVLSVVLHPPPIHSVVPTARRRYATDEPTVRVERALTITFVRQTALRIVMEFPAFEMFRSVFATAHMETV